MGLAVRKGSPPVLGRYEIVGPLGRGATSTVYRARDLSSGGEVALKAVPVELDLRERVDREVRAAAILSHPALVPIIDWGEDDDNLYLVSELVEGTPLDRLFKEGTLHGDDATIVHAVADVLEALEHAHMRGVVHRDVKPANVILQADGYARLTDLGVARVAGESGLTMTGGVIGTVAYMAPEQAVGRTATGASDVYSAALLLYEGLTGRNPILGGGPAEIARKAAAGNLPSVGTLRPDLPRKLAQAIDLALSRDPAARPTPGLLARVLRAEAEQWGRTHRSTTRGARAAPALACAAGGALLTGWAVARLAEPGLFPVLGAMLVAALAFARAPRGATVVFGAAALLVFGAGAPGAAMVIGALGLGLLVLAPRDVRRAFLLPLLAPLLLAVGLGPLFAVAVAGVERLRSRVWVAVTGVAAAAGWHVLTGGSMLVLTSADVSPAAPALEGVRDPTTAGSRFLEPLREHPEALAGAALLVTFALLFPLVTRARPGGGRTAAGAAWSVGLMVLAIGLAGAGPVAIEALLPSCILVAAWAARPWRLLARRAESRSTALLRESPEGL